MPVCGHSPELRDRQDFWIRPVRLDSCRSFCVSFGGIDFFFLLEVDQEKGKPRTLPFISFPRGVFLPRVQLLVKKPSNRRGAVSEVSLAPSELGAKLPIES